MKKPAERDGLALVPGYSGPRAGYDGDQRKKASKVPMAVDTWGHLLAMHVALVNEQERAQAGELAQQGQAVIGETVGVAFADQGDTGQDLAQAARTQGIDLHIVKLPEAKTGGVLLPRRWGGQRNCGWLNRFRRLTRDDERLPETLAGRHCVVVAMLMLIKCGQRSGQSRYVDKSLKGNGIFSLNRKRHEEKSFQINRFRT